MSSYKKLYKYTLLPITFTILGLIISPFIIDSYKVTQLFEVGKFQGKYIVEPEELMVNLKSKDIQKLVYAYLDQNIQIEEAQKIFSDLRIYRNKYISVTVHDVNAEDASRKAEQLSNAIIMYTNQLLIEKEKFIDQEIRLLDQSIAIAKKILTTQVTNSGCNQNMIYSMASLQINNFNIKKNEIMNTLSNDKTFPSKLISEYKEVYHKSKEYQLLMILILSSIGFSLSLLQYIRHEK